MPLKVYYLDDEPDLCENFSDALSSNEIVVTTFSRAQLLFEAVKKSAPDLIFLDYRLPGTNGDDVARELPVEIPKFLITGDLSVKAKYPFLKVFEKPYKTEDILAAIDEVSRAVKAA